MHIVDKYECTFWTNTNTHCLPSAWQPKKGVKGELEQTQESTNTNAHCRQIQIHIFCRAPGNPKKEEKRKPGKNKSRQIQIHEWQAAQFGAITTMADKLQIQEGKTQGTQPQGERGI